MILVGLRRLAVVLAIAVAATALVGVVVGLVSDASIQRALSLAYMLGGAFLMLIGFASGLRSWSRGADDNELAIRGQRVESSAVLIGIGLTLMVLGIGLDPRSEIV